MKDIKFFDTTLRDGEQTPGASLTINEKVEIARLLDKLGVDIIEGGFAISSQGEFNALREISKIVKNATVASLSRCVPKDIDRAYDAVKNAVSPRLHVFLATSPIHMKYKLKMTEDEVYESAVNMVKYAKKLCSNIEFSAEDASRSHPEFLYKIFEGVIEAGAVCINVPDTVGYAYPGEFGKLIKNIKENVKNIDKADISVHCHNDLGMAVSNSLEAVLNGATQVECTVNGLGERAGNAALEEIVMALNTRKDLFDFKHNINTKRIYKTSRAVSKLTGVDVQPHKAIVGINAFAHESGIHQHGVLTERTTYEIMTPESIGLSSNKIKLGKLSGRHAFEEKVKELDFNLTPDQFEQAFSDFKDLADKKNNVLDEDIMALIEQIISKGEETYKLISHQINSGNKIISTATIELMKDEKVIYEASTGSGPVEAAYNAVNRLTGINLELIEYKLRAITEGREAIGEVMVKVEYEGRNYMGRGISTDVIESSIKAYINAINRILNFK